MKRKSQAVLEKSDSNPVVNNMNLDEVSGASESNQVEDPNTDNVNPNHIEYCGKYIDEMPVNQIRSYLKELGADVKGQKELIMSRLSQLVISGECQRIKTLRTLRNTPARRERGLLSAGKSTPIKSSSRNSKSNNRNSNLTTPPGQTKNTPSRQRISNRSNDFETSMISISKRTKKKKSVDNDNIESKDNNVIHDHDQNEIDYSNMNNDGENESVNYEVHGDDDDNGDTETQTDDLDDMNSERVEYQSSARMGSEIQEDNVEFEVDIEYNNNNTHSGYHNNGLAPGSVTSPHQDRYDVLDEADELQRGGDVEEAEYNGVDDNGDHKVEEEEDDESDFQDAIEPQLQPNIDRTEITRKIEEVAKYYHQDYIEIHTHSTFDDSAYEKNADAVDQKPSEEVVNTVRRLENSSEKHQVLGDSEEKNHSLDASLDSSPLENQESTGLASEGEAPVLQTEAETQVQSVVKEDEKLARINECVQRMLRGDYSQPLTDEEFQEVLRRLRVNDSVTRQQHQHQNQQQSSVSSEGGRSEAGEEGLVVQTPLTVTTVNDSVDSSLVVDVRDMSVEGNSNFRSKETGRDHQLATNELYDGASASPRASLESTANEPKSQLKRTDSSNKGIFGSPIPLLSVAWNAIIGPFSGGKQKTPAAASPDVEESLGRSDHMENGRDTPVAERKTYIAASTDSMPPPGVAAQTAPAHLGHSSQLIDSPEGTDVRVRVDAFEDYNESSSALPLHLRPRRIGQFGSLSGTERAMDINVDLKHGVPQTRDGTTQSVSVDEVVADKRSSSKQLGTVDGTTDVGKTGPQDTKSSADVEEQDIRNSAPLSHFLSSANSSSSTGRARYQPLPGRYDVFGKPQIEYRPSTEAASLSDASSTSAVGSLKRGFDSLGWTQEEIVENVFKRQTRESSPGYLSSQSELPTRAWGLESASPYRVQPQQQPQAPTSSQMLSSRRSTPFSTSHDNEYHPTLPENAARFPSAFVPSISSNGSLVSYGGLPSNGFPLSGIAAQRRLRRRSELAASKVSSEASAMVAKKILESLSDVVPPLIEQKRRPTSIRWNDDAAGNDAERRGLGYDNKASQESPSLKSILKRGRSPSIDAPDDEKDEDDMASPPNEILGLKRNKLTDEKKQKEISNQSSNNSLKNTTSLSGARKLTVDDNDRQATSRSIEKKGQVDTDEEFTFESPRAEPSLVDYDAGVKEDQDSSIRFVFSPPRSSQRERESLVSRNKENQLKQQETQELPLSAVIPTAPKTPNSSDISKTLVTPFNHSSNTDDVPQGESIWTKKLDTVKCKVCWVQNAKTAVKCVSCESDLDSSSSSIAGSSFGPPSSELKPSNISSSFGFSAPPKSAPTAPGSLGPSGFTFGVQTPSAATDSLKPVSSSTVSSSSFGGFAAPSKISFGTTDQPSPASSQNKDPASQISSSGFSFGASKPIAATPAVPSSTPSFGFLPSSSSSGTSAALVPLSNTAPSFSMNSVPISDSAASKSGGFQSSSQSTEKQSIASSSLNSDSKSISTTAPSFSFGSSSSLSSSSFGLNSAPSSDIRNEPKEKTNIAFDSKPSFGFSSGTTSQNSGVTLDKSSASQSSTFSGFSFGAQKDSQSNAAVTPDLTATSSSFSFGAIQQKKRGNEDSQPVRRNDDTDDADGPRKKVLVSTSQFDVGKNLSTVNTPGIIGFSFGQKSSDSNALEKTQLSSTGNNNLSGGVAQVSSTGSVLSFGANPSGVTSSNAFGSSSLTPLSSSSTPVGSNPAFGSIPAQDKEKGTLPAPSFSFGSKLATLSANAEISKTISSFTSGALTPSSGLSGFKFDSIPPTSAPSGTSQSVAPSLSIGGASGGTSSTIASGFGSSTIAPPAPSNAPSGGFSFGSSASSTANIFGTTSGTNFSKGPTSDPIFGKTGGTQPIPGPFGSITTPSRPNETTTLTAPAFPRPTESPGASMDTGLSPSLGPTPAFGSSDPSSFNRPFGSIASSFGAQNTQSLSQPSFSFGNSSSGVMGGTPSGPFGSTTPAAATATNPSVGNGFSASKPFFFGGQAASGPSTSTPSFDFNRLQGVNNNPAVNVHFGSVTPLNSSATPSFGTPSVGFGGFGSPAPAAAPSSSSGATAFNLGSVDKDKRRKVKAKRPN